MVREVGVDAEDIILTYLPKVLCVGIDIWMLDTNDSVGLLHIDSDADDGVDSSGIMGGDPSKLPMWKPKLSLLYRPGRGHYDLLYSNTHSNYTDVGGLTIPLSNPVVEEELRVIIAKRVNAKEISHVESLQNDAVTDYSRKTDAELRQKKTKRVEVVLLMRICLPPLGPNHPLVLRGPHLLRIPVGC